MAYTNIDDPSAFFHTQIFTGGGTSNDSHTNNAHSGDFQPDLIWAKDRVNAYNHDLVDSSRGPTVAFHPNTTVAEYTRTQSNYDFTSFDSNGFTTGAPDFTNSFGGNTNSNGKVAWQWKANGGTTTSVSASGTGSGCVNASTHQVNQDAGFSIITYTGRDDQTGDGEMTKLTHGLDVAPAFTIMKNRSTGSWVVLGKNVTESSPYSHNEHLILNTTAAINAVTYTGNTYPDSTYIYLGNALVNVAADDYVCYAFAEKQGYSKFGKYVGNGNANGSFVYTGFKPAFVMIKNYTNAGHDWQMLDTKITPNNPYGTTLVANGSGAEISYTICDIVSNGFKFRNTNSAWNGSGEGYIYMAFAENPFTTSTGVPTTAR